MGVTNDEGVDETTGHWIAALFAISLLFIGSTQIVFAGYEEEVLADDPIAYWRLDEGPGCDRSGEYWSRPLTH